MRASPFALAVVVTAVALGGPRAAAPKGDREFGQYLAAECVTCHQTSGRYDGIPPIVGWPEETFVEIMGEYRAGTRDNAVMRTIASKLSDEELLALAAYFHSLGPNR